MQGKAQGTTTQTGEGQRGPLEVTWARTLALNLF